MTVYVFGNPDVEEDNAAIKVAEELAGKVAGIEYKIVSPNEDLDFSNQEPVVIMDVVYGIETPILIEDREDIDKLIAPPRGTVHDFDLGFQIKYLMKLEKLGKVKVIGLPVGKEINYDLVQEILRRLVAEKVV